MKKTITIIFIFFLLFLPVSSYNYISFATSNIEGSEGSGSGSIDTVDPNFYNPSDSGISDSDKKAIKLKTGIILGWLRNISAIVSVIAIMVVGFKYILGSVDEKAKYKETLIPIFIGALMAVSGTTLISFIYNNV